MSCDHTQIKTRTTWWTCARILQPKYYRYSWRWDVPPLGCKQSQSPGRSRKALKVGGSISLSNTTGIIFGQRSRFHFEAPIARTRTGKCYHFHVEMRVLVLRYLYTPREPSLNLTECPVTMILDISLLSIAAYFFLDRPQCDENPACTAVGQQTEGPTRRLFTPQSDWWRTWRLYMSASASSFDTTTCASVSISDIRMSDGSGVASAVRYACFDR
jgi:hypothetical protein